MKHHILHHQPWNDETGRRKLSLSSFTTWFLKPKSQWDLLSSRQPIIWGWFLKSQSNWWAPSLPLFVSGIQTHDCQLAKWIRTWNGEILGLGKWSTSRVNFCCLLPSRERGNIYNGSKRFGKIIHSKVPAGFGDLWSFPEKCSLFLKHVPYIW